MSCDFKAFWRKNGKLCIKKQGMKRLEKTFIFLQGAQLIYIKKSTRKPHFWSLLPKARLVLLINGFRNIKKFEIKFDKTIDVVVK
jgi:hypothetical protein